MSNIIQSIKQFAGLSTDRLINQQSAYIPRIDNNFIEYIGYRYILNGVEYKSSTTGDILFKVRYDFVRSIDKPIAVGEYDMESVLGSKNIPLFLLFIDGIFIPYDIMKLVVDDYNNLFIKMTRSSTTIPTNSELINIDLDNSDEEYNIELPQEDYVSREDYFANLLKENSYIQVILPTGDIAYTKDTVIPSNALYVFGSDDGKFTLDNDNTDTKYIFYPVSSSMNYYKKLSTSGAITNMEVFDSDELDKFRKIKLSDKNVMLFADGLLRSGTPEPLARCDKQERIVDGIARQYDGIAYNIVTASNPEVEFRTTLLTVHDIEADDINCILSVNPYSDESIDNVYKVDEQYIKNNIDSQTTILEDFNPKVNNVDDMIAYIMQYNPAILNDLIHESTNISIERLTYSDQKIIPVVHKHSEDRLLVFVDGELYGLDYMTYKRGNCIIDMTHIANKDTAIIELIRFKDVDNSTGVVHSSNPDVVTSGWFNNSDNKINANTELFSKEASNSEYTYPESGMQMFKVDYSLEYNPDTGLTRIITDDPFYNDKDLYYYSKNRFVSFTASYNDAPDREYFEVDLGTDDRFKACHDYYRFMVFINGIRLMCDKYRLVLPVRQTTPFYEARLYLSVPFKAGDIVTVIYTPNIVYDMVASLDAETGDLSVLGLDTRYQYSNRPTILDLDRTPCNYQISKNLNMIWVNGKKVPNDYITDVGFNRLHINTDLKSTQSVYLSKYIEDLDILKNLLSASKWDAAVVDNENKNSMLNISDTTMTNTESDSYAGKTDIEAIMNEIMRDQFISKVDITVPFTYGYEDIDASIITDEDSAGNSTIETMDANEKHSISLSDVDRKLV